MLLKILFISQTEAHTLACTLAVVTILPPSSLWAQKGLNDVFIYFHIIYSLQLGRSSWHVCSTSCQLSNAGPHPSGSQRRRSSNFSPITRRSCAGPMRRLPEYRLANEVTLGCEPVRLRHCHIRAQNTSRASLRW